MSSLTEKLLVSQIELRSMELVYTFPTASVVPGRYASIRNLFFFPSNIAVLPFQILIQDFKFYHTNLYINGHVFNRFHIYVMSPKILCFFFYLSFTMAQQPPVGQGLLVIEDSPSHLFRHIARVRNPLDE
jgi:hypothetical protein